MASHSTATVILTGGYSIAAFELVQAHLDTGVRS
jgi:hypothetical protein